MKTTNYEFKKINNTDFKLFVNRIFTLLVLIFYDLFKKVTGQG
ncbi:MAG: hypothetical protein ACI91R_000213 [Vicingaceae bacterium]|jgi:hypothetical protein